MTLFREKRIRPATVSSSELGLEASKRRPALRASVVAQSAVSGFVSKYLIEGTRNNRLAVSATTVLALAGTAWAGFKSGLAPEFVRNDSINKYPTNFVGQMTGAALRKARSPRTRMLGETLVALNLNKARTNGMPIYINEAPVVTHEVFAGSATKPPLELPQLDVPISSGTETAIVSENIGVEAHKTAQLVA